jgi:AraC-like DNA-binding protein
VHFASLPFCCNAAALPWQAVNVDGHLYLRQSVLPASAEWNGVWSCWRFVQIERGEGYWVAANQRKAVAAGEVLVVPPNATGVLRASQIGPVTIHHFQLCVSWLSGLLTLSERQALDSLAKGPSAVLFFPASHPISRRFLALAETAPSHTPFLNRCHLLELAAEALAGKSAEPRGRRDLPIFACERFQQIISQYTEKELLQWPIERLAQICNCSVRHFRALFRKHFGVSFSARQSRMRLLEAASRLREGRIGVEELARECGYRHTRSFGIAFKREFGCTPAAWRSNPHGGSPPECPANPPQVLTES